MKAQPVFNSEEEATWEYLMGKLEQDVIVIRYEGPRGGPMREMLNLRYTEWARSVALITDGRFSGEPEVPALVILTRSNE